MHAQSWNIIAAALGLYVMAFGLSVWMGEW